MMASNTSMGILLFIASVLVAFSIYFLTVKRYHYAVWTGFFSVVIFEFVIALWLDNRITYHEINEDLTPDLFFNIYQEPDPPHSKYKYPFQEYTLSISNNNLKSVSMQHFTIELHFPFEISRITENTSFHSGASSFISHMRVIKRKGNVISEEELIQENESKYLSIKKWKRNNEYVNSNVAIFNCREFTADMSFEGRIVIDLTKPLSSVVQLPGLVESYTGKYFFKIEGKKSDWIKIRGDIPKPNISAKLSEKHYDQGKILQKKANFNSAIEKYTKAINLNCKFYYAYLDRGLCFRKTGKNKEALMDFDRVIEMSPKYGMAYYNRALARIETGEYETEEIKDDLLKASQYGVDDALREYMSLVLDDLDPNNGFVEFLVRNDKWLEKNNDFIDIIPHVLKGNIEIHGYRDEDNIFKVLISNAFSDKVLLQFKNLNKIKNAPVHPKHVIRVQWNRGENKLYIDGALVDVYPKETQTSILNDSYVFRNILNTDPLQGYIEIGVSEQELFEANGIYADIIPHIITDDFEIHGYKDKDNIFKFLINNAVSENVVLKCQNLDKLRTAPTHPKHVIVVQWNRGENKLYIDDNLIDIYPQKE